MINPSHILTDLVTRVAEAGRSLTGIEFGATVSIETLCEYLVSEKGEATGIAIAKEILSRYQDLDTESKRDFFLMLLNDFGSNEAMMKAAFDDWNQKGIAAARAIHLASEPKSIEFISRLNRVNGAASQIVEMRSDLLGFLKENPELKALDEDFKHLLISWFNRGFLELRSIDWSTSAKVLERIIEYEAVHEIQGWDDLKRRVEAPDRRLYAYFHPAMEHEPLIFVEVALMDSHPDAIQSILTADREPLDPQKATTAAFYSISNCQPGLRGISFGNFLIKKAVMELQRNQPQIKTFVTLSPVPGIHRFIKSEIENPSGVLSASQLSFINEIHDNNELPTDKDDVAALREIAATYLVNARSNRGTVYDPVARFHLGNGACLQRVHANANLSKTPDGAWRDWGLMVNYEYKLQEIEKNHEAFVNDNLVMSSSEVQALVKKGAKRS